jgi:cell division protease FtsH
MRFIFKTSYDQDIRLAKHGGQVFWYGLLLLMLQNYWQAAKTVEPVPYSEFEKALAEGRVAEVLVSDRTVTGRLKSPDSRGKTTIVATRVEPDLAERLS